MNLNSKNYDPVNHLELVNYSKNLEKNGKSLSTKDSLQLLEYSAMVYSQLNWNIHNQYLEIFTIFSDYLEYYY